MNHSHHTHRPSLAVPPAPLLAAVPTLLLPALLLALPLFLFAPPAAAGLFSSTPVSFCPGFIFDPINFIQNLATARRSASLVRQQAEAALSNEARLIAAQLQHKTFDAEALSSVLRLKSIGDLRDFAAAAGNLKLLDDLESLMSFQQSARELERALGARFENMQPLLTTIANSAGDNREALTSAVSEAEARARGHLLHDYQREVDAMLDVQQAYVRNRALAERIPQSEGQQQSLQLLNTQLNSLTVGMGQVVGFMISAADGGLQQQRSTALEQQRHQLDGQRRVGDKLDFIHRQGAYILGTDPEQRQ